MTSDEIRKKYLEFFESKGHKIIPSASLVPENDPSVLFTTAGMQQFKPYYIGKKNAQEDFGTLNTVSVQKCVRTSDIDEVGDESHLTFFEMLGNFSFGGYWKKEAIKYAYEFITGPEWMNLKIDYVTVFEGEGNVPTDIESEKIWKSVDPSINVKKFGRADNFWGPTGEEGPCGPTTEIYVDGIEIWNIVFNEFYQNADKSLTPLEIKGIDTGMGLERLTKVVQKVPTVFDTDLFGQIIENINKLTQSEDVASKRIVTDHIRSAIFMIASGITPSNTEGGYVLRRLIRRARYYFNSLGAEDKRLGIFSEYVAKIYKDIYPELEEKKDNIGLVITLEESAFFGHLMFGKKLLEKIISSEKYISGENAFLLYSTYGFPFELILEIAKRNCVEVDVNDFNERKKRHQEISKAGMEQKFKGGLGGHSEMEIKYHTATHLLLAALRKVLSGEIVQKGSNITAERLRFDFNWPEKLSPEQLKEVEDLVNKKIKENIPVEMMELPKEEAMKIVTTLSFDLSKYGDMVKVYKIGDFSIEFCGGPHVERTGDLANSRDPEGNPKGNFKITKEEASSQGIRRIKAILE